MARTLYSVDKTQPGRYAIEALSGELIAGNIRPQSVKEEKNLAIDITAEEIETLRQTLKEMPLFLKLNGFAEPFNRAAMTCEKPKKDDALLAIILLKEGITLREVAQAPNIEAIFALCEHYDTCPD